MHSVFVQIIVSIISMFKEEAEKLGDDAYKYQLSFYFFTTNLLYCIIKGIKSISLLVTDIKTSSDAKQFDLKNASKSMYSEAFLRYDPTIYRRIFYRLLEQMNFLEVPEIKALGRICCVDGSVFPALINMTWANYKQTANAIKLHLVLELNRMIPVQFISTDANTSEKAVLLQIIEAGVTYISDRGYVCFKLFAQIAEKKAYFIIKARRISFILFKST